MLGGNGGGYGDDDAGGGGGGGDKHISLRYNDTCIFFKCELSVGGARVPARKGDESRRLSINIRCDKVRNYNKFQKKIYLLL